jgi:DNA mismatch endonuclease (patch repair protein)
VADVVSKAVRSRMMAGIRGTNTRPELTLRRLLHRRGFRFRVHGSGLLGRPDIVLRRFHAAILVHGCFWHRHKNCPYAYSPKSNKRFWRTKFVGNLRRDARTKQNLLDAGWRVLVVWECSLRGTTAAAESTARAVARWMLSRQRYAELPKRARA